MSNPLNLDVWSAETSKTLLTVPWSHHQSGDSTLLVKLSAVNTSSGPYLLCLATDLSGGAWFEGLSTRRLKNRFTDAYSASQDDETQSQFETVASNGDEALLARAQELVGDVRSGAARSVNLSQVSFDNVITIVLPNYSFRFMCDPLEAQTAQCLSQHLITPLLGLSASLLSLVGVKAIEDGSLAQAIDVSARSERANEGRASKLFFQHGGSALGRWMQRFTGTREKDILPITLQSTRKSPASSHAPSPSASVATKHTAPPLPTSPKPNRSIARQMLNHKGNTSPRGERIGWDDSQLAETSAAASPSAKALGKQSQRLGPRGQSTADEPRTTEMDQEFDSFPAPPPHQPQKRRASASPLPITADEGEARELSGSEPATEPEDEETLLRPAPTRSVTGSINSQTQSQPSVEAQPASGTSSKAPTPAPPLPPPSAPTQSKEERKAKEVKEEADARARTIARAKEAAAKAAAAASAGVVKKKKKKL